MRQVLGPGERASQPGPGTGNEEGTALPAPGDSPAPGTRVAPPPLLLTLI